MPPLFRFQRLTQLIVRNNQIRELPSYWPNTMEIIDCAHNQISVIRSLPPKLLWFDCSHNQISTICPLPPHTRVFLCDHNQINELPRLSEDLVDLYASYNQIQCLPILPLELVTLSCSNNLLRQLPDPLPNTLTELVCNDNPMTMIPRIPSSVSALTLNDEFMQWLDRVPRDHADRKVQYVYEVLIAFREAYYSAKFRRPLRDALWRIREKHAMEDMHPSVIRRMLSDGIDMEDIYMILIPP